MFPMSRNLSRLLATVLLAACGAKGQDVLLHAPLRVGKTAVTAVTGESWLNHLNRPFGYTAMGKTGRLGPAPGQQGTYRTAPLLAGPATSILVSGADLYRLSCQGCHGESGQGTPPEVNSLINPVRATSVTLVIQRMKTSGIDITQANAAQLAKQATTALLERLHQGGESMPAFSYLDENEIASVIAYLRQLASVPNAETSQIKVKEVPLRIGELVVKSTCHICHSATGTNPNPQQLLEGAIPPLESLTSRVNQPDFIRKVTRGAPIVMGEAPSLYRGRMPVFYYLSEEEANDAYLYLSHYPPIESARSNAKRILLQQPGSTEGGTGVGSDIPVSSTPTPSVYQHQGGTDLKTVALLSGLSGFVILLLVGGIGLTLREFKRLSAHSRIPGRGHGTRPG